jgi:hypothetical protein
MAPRRRRYGDIRVAIARAPVPRLLREDYRTEDGDTDDRWASAVMLSYLGLALLIGIAALYWSMGPRPAS